MDDSTPSLRVKKIWKDLYIFSIAIPILMNDSLNTPQSHLAPCSILCDACPLGSGAVAESAGQYPQAHHRLPDPRPCLPSCTEEWPSTFCLKESINIFDRNISFS